MDSTIKKRSIIIGGNQASISLEDIWGALREIARERTTTVPKPISTFDSSRDRGNLLSAIRVFVLDHYPGVS
jgi:predicted DNA-binding ribbon-helix-helix protein